MNQQDDDKATAKILLSADEAVAKKIRDVLISNPDIVREAIKQMHLEDDRRAQEIRNQMYQHSVAAQAQGMRNAYAQGGITQVNQDELQRGWWSGVFGGNK